MTEATPVPQPDDERHSRPPMDEGRAMMAIRAAHIRSVIEGGRVPDGYRVNAEGTGFVKKGNPAWPVRPLDPNCHDYCEANDDLAELIRQQIPGFDPESDRRWWLQVAELVRRSRGGRTPTELLEMRHDELVAFFRLEAIHREGGQSSGGQRSTYSVGGVGGGSATPAASAAREPAATKGKETTRQILRRMLDDRIGRAQLMAAGSAEEVGKLIGRSASTVKETKPEWKQLCRLFRIQRSNERLDRELEDGRNN